MPGYEEHKKRHEELKQDSLKFIKELTQEGPSAKIIAHIQETMYDWWKTHVVEEDQEFGEFLKVRLDEPDDDVLPA